MDYPANMREEKKPVREPAQASTTERVDKHIERITSGRAALHDLCQCIMMYEELSQKYGEVLREIQNALNDQMGLYLLARHDLLNPPRLVRKAPAASGA